MFYIYYIQRNNINLSLLQNNSSIENAFAGFIDETKEDEVIRTKQEQEAVVQLFTSFNEVCPVIILWILCILIFRNILMR